nr:MAG TPA: hypothetical protein [Caudoviricetes sp.]
MVWHFLPFRLFRAFFTGVWVASVLKLFVLVV